MIYNKLDGTKFRCQKPINYAYWLNLNGCDDIPEEDYNDPSWNGWTK
jgi:hypothetical protein